MRGGAAWQAVVMSGLLAACGPTVSLLDDDSTEPGSTSDVVPPPTMTSGTVPPPTTTTTPPATTSVTTATTVTPDGSSSFDGVSFLDDGADDGNFGDECDVFEQDCPPGEKCMPWANDGGAAWNALTCRPIAEDAAGPAEACTVEGSAVSGFDTCDGASMCWDVDPDTLEGYCIPFCVGNLETPSCDDPDRSCVVTNSGVLAICLPQCDPVLQDCPPDHACYPFGDDFVCSFDSSEHDGEPGDPCEFLASCHAGTMCANADYVPGCDGFAGCCTSFCDLTAEVPEAVCLPEQVCIPYYEEGAMPGTSNIGICGLPQE